MERKQFGIIFYADRRGKSPVLDFIKELEGANGKQALARLKKVRLFLRRLKNEGTFAGMPMTRHLDGDIWELRPLSDRILFAAWDGENYVMLHHFVKKTQKTPAREIEQARRNLEDFKLREA